MRYWIYREPLSETCDEAVWHVWSDAAILADYWTDWCELMRKAGREPQISKNNCINDWATTHWAAPATPENLLRIIWAPKGT
jgi:hypothetical protein